MNKKIKYEKSTYEVKGDLISFTEKILYNTETNEVIYDEEIDRENDINLFNNYRRKHGLLLPEEIKKIREIYDISQKDLCKILGWGEKTITRYENGSIQDKAHNNVLLLIKDNYLNFERLLEHNRNSLSKDSYNKYKAICNKNKVLVNNKYINLFKENQSSNSEYVKDKEFFDLNTYTNPLIFKIKEERLQ